MRILRSIALTGIIASHLGATAYTVKAGGGGTYTTIQACATAAVAGDSCTVFAGTYGETVTPANSGSAGNVVTYIVNSGDTVVMHGWVLGSKSYLTIDGFEITAGQITIVAPDHIIIQNNYIHNTTSRCINGPITTASGASTYITVKNNILDLCGDGTQQGIYVEGNHWLIDGNTFSRLEDGIALYGDRHVIRNNHFGPLHVADVGPTVHPDALESSCAGDYPLTRMLFENNVILDWGPDDSNAHTLLLRDTNSCGQSDQIIRFNATLNTGSYWISNDTNSLNERIYNNSVSNTQVALSPKDFVDSPAFTNGSTGGKVINNILTNMTRVGSADYCYYQDSSSLTGFIEHHNLCFNTGWSGAWQTPLSGKAASDIYNSDPTFVAPLTDLHLIAGSPAIGTGGQLTTVAGGDSGSGTSLVVVDAGFFQDGYGITNVQADWIRVGASSTAQISSINYATNTITLVSGITRSSGDNVFLYKNSNGTVVLNGSAPDMGAYQFSASNTAGSFLGSKNTIAGPSVMK